jgi:hypothetical protein
MAADSFVAAARIGRIEADCVHRVLAAVSLRLQALGNAAQGWFDRRDDGIRVCWSDPEGRILQEEPLQEFIASASRNLAAHLAHLAQGPDPRALREKGLSLLRQVSPALAGLVADVGMQGCTVGRRLAVVSARHGMPLHIWLYLSESYPSVGTAACILSADRPHGEFILEASDGNLFYFPPCLLSARLVFDGQRVLVEHPRIREPANGYRWGHPYTGDLVRDPFASARVPESAHKALAAPSKWALRTFPTLGTRMPGAGEADLCLEGQSERVQTIAAQLGRDLETGARRALPTAVTALHDLARIGLTTAHQNNASAPRVPLTAERMPYPVPKGVVPDSPHTRVFTYAARRLTASSAPQARAASPPEPLLPGPFQLDFESRMDTGVRRFDSHLRRFLRLR